VSEFVTIFSTRSPVEADVVRGLLEANGVMPVVSSATSRSTFPFSVSQLGEVRLSVHPEEAEEARRIIDTHRTELHTGQVVRLRDEFDVLQRALDYRFRDRGLLEHALTHTSRANEDASGGVVDNESLEFLGDAVLGFLIADLLFREFPTYDEGQKSKIKASLVSTGTLGPDHRKQFQVAVIVEGDTIAEGIGGSKKEAEQEAARRALDRLRGIER
jgi:ribonuclease-3